MHQSGLGDGGGSQAEDEDPQSSDSDASDDAIADAIDDEFAELKDDSDDDIDTGFESNRELCPDASCIGVINDRGVCAECGASESAPKNASEIQASKVASAEGVDLIHRNLCPDGGCIGILGPDGCCKECGLVGDNVLSDPRLRGLKTPAVEDSEDSDDSEAETTSKQVASAPQSNKTKNKDGDGFSANRQLCPDGGCIGIIGPDGTCKECGTVL